MKLKNFVAIFLAIAVFVTGSILLIGAMPKEGFFVAYLIFSIIVVALTIFMISKMDNKWNVAYLLIIGIIFAAFLSTFAVALKETSDEYKKTLEVQDLANQELQLEQQKLNYYTELIKYFENEINITNTTNANLEKQIEEMKKLKNEIIIPPVIVEEIPEQIVYYYEYEDDDWEDEEDEEEDDDD